MKKALILLVTIAACAISNAKNFEVKSPDGTIVATVSATGNLSYSVSVDGKTVLKDSRVAMKFDGGISFGKGDKVKNAQNTSTKETLKPVIYKKAKVVNNYNELTLTFKEFDLVFRAYDDGVAYRFVSKLKGARNVIGETVEFVFPGDCYSYLGYVNSQSKEVEKQFHNSFENTYEAGKLSAATKNRLVFLPSAFEAENGVKLCISEADLLHYPGMYLSKTDDSNVLRGVFSTYPKTVQQGGHNQLEGLVNSRENFIAKVEGPTAFPWRVVGIARNDKDLANSDLVWKLSKPCANPADYSWVKPGKVAWDWWNNWNLYGVDFESGINNETYKYYIDFASAKGIEYVILDEGWAVNLEADLFKIVPEIDLPMLCEYAESKNVGLILWAGYWAFNRDIEGVCRHYSEMGIKGFKVDFMNRDDQPMVEFYTKSAEIAAKYHLVLDFHGAFKPAGLQRTYPNVLNYEGVHGLEQMKWKNNDQVTYDVTIPFIRMFAGPMDYTQGAMKNANKKNFAPIYTEPMSQGTRCRQLAEYVIFESPLNMLCDSPSNYMAEPECTKYIAECPTTWDETVALDGKIGEYVVIARRKGDKWYLGALTNWDKRDLSIDLSFLGEGVWTRETFRDGVNAAKVAKDFTHSEVVNGGRKLRAHLAPGGGFVAIFTKK